MELLTAISISSFLFVGLSSAVLISLDTLTTTPGDTTMVTLDQVQAFAKGGSARIQR